MRRALLVLLMAMLPSAGAAVPFVLEYDDPAGDNPAPSADVVRVASTVRDGLVTQRIEMAGPPDLLQDTLIVRSWFHNSTNGSFHVVDLEVHARAEGDAKFRALARRGAFENVTPIDATWAVEGDAYVFTFAEAVVADASCFDPIVWAQHEPEDGAWSADQGGIGTRYCRVRGDPSPAPTVAAATRAAPPAPAAADPSSGPTSGPTAGPSSGPSTARSGRVDVVAAPGTHAPAFSPWVLAGVVAAASLLTIRTSRRS